MTTLRNITKVTAAGSLGWIGGLAYERFKPFKVEAATIIPINRPTLPPAPSSNASRAAQIMRFGFPGTDSIRMFDDYILSYDKRNRTANWVFEHLTPETVTFNDEVDRSSSEFKEDEAIHPYFRSQNIDYRRSGYDRGHLAAAGNHRFCQKHMDETFYLSNISPQVGKGFNRDSWNRLERYTRNLTKTHKNVYVCTGPLYLPRKEDNGRNYIKYEVIGANNVAVPTHFFKVIVRETHNSEFHLESFVMPNAAIDDSSQLQDFYAPLNAIERSSGLLFFEKFPKDILKSVNGR